VHSLPDLVRKPMTMMLHAAFPTQDRVTSLGDRAYLSTVAHLRAVVLATIRRQAPLDLVYISSGAATSVARGIRVAHRTRVYGLAKLEDEEAFRRAIASTGGRLCIVRAYALSGPYMTKPETYALGNMILQAHARGAIDVRADHLVRRSYTAIEDMVRIAMHAVAALDPGEHLTFETAGEVVEISELARRVLEVLGCNPGAVSRPPLDPQVAPDDYLGDPEIVRSLAAKAEIVPMELDDQIASTAAWLVNRTEG